VEGRGRVEAHRSPHPVGDQRVYGDAPVDLVEVRERDTGIQLTRTVSAADRGPFDVVEQALREVARGHGVLEALLVLDADPVEAEVVGDPQGGDVHLELAEQLGLSQLGVIVG